MWCLKRVSRPGHASWLYGFELAASVFIRRGPSEAAEIHIRCLTLVVIGMVVLALAVGLPYFDHRIVKWRTIRVQHPAFQPEAFAFSMRLGDARHRMGSRQADLEVGSRGLRRCWHVFHDHASNGVASGPRSTMSNRKPSAHC